jgi:hypothetical protein
MLRGFVGILLIATLPVTAPLCLLLWIVTGRQYLIEIADWVVLGE